MCPEAPCHSELSSSSNRAEVSREAPSLWPFQEDATVPLSPCSAVVLSPPQQLRFGDTEAGETVTEIGMARDIDLDARMAEHRLRFSGEDDVQTLAASSEACSGPPSPRLHDGARPPHSPDRGAGQCLPLCEESLFAIDAAMEEEEAIGDVLRLARSLPDRWRGMPLEVRSRLTGDLDRLRTLLQNLPGNGRGEEHLLA